MEDFINGANYHWKQIDPVSLAAWTLWRLNYIHPFINGNGRTARAVCYFVLCVKAGGLLPGSEILPELLVRERTRYCEALAAVDESMKTTFSIVPVHSLVAELLAEQLGLSKAPAPTPTPQLTLPPPPADPPADPEAK
jgi:Fic family protein